MKLRGFHSNSSSSTASSTAANGVANMAAMPAAAPATSSVLRSPEERWNAWARSEPKAPPVMMIGPSAPNGPPVPIEIADDSGFSTATFSIHAALPDQDRLERLGNAVAADPLRAVARHQADDQAAEDRDRNRPQTGMGIGGGDERARHFVVVEEMGEQPNQPNQPHRDHGADPADQDRDAGEPEDAGGSGEVGESVSAVVSGFDGLHSC